MQKGSEATGSKLWERATSLRYHVADRRGRYYLCGCAPRIRIGDRTLNCNGKRFFYSRRWPVLRSTANFRSFLRKREKL